MLEAKPAGIHPRKWGLNRKGISAVSLFLSDPPYKYPGRQHGLTQLERTLARQESKPPPLSQSR
jgi:hypothetical protein